MSLRLVEFLNTVRVQLFVIIPQRALGARPPLESGPGASWNARSAHRDGRTCGGSTSVTTAPPPRPTGAFTAHSVANGCDPARSWTLERSCSTFVPHGLA
jgi:hypothetical protein